MGWALCTATCPIAPRFKQTLLVLPVRQVAAQLAANGLAAGDSVALIYERSVGAIAAMLGTLRAGCVFVPIDAAFPDG